MRILLSKNRTKLKLRRYLSSKTFQMVLYYLQRVLTYTFNNWDRFLNTSIVIEMVAFPVLKLIKLSLNSTHISHVERLPRLLQSTKLMMMLIFQRFILFHRFTLLIEAKHISDLQNFLE